jgi:hypothetical protein
MVLVFFNRKTLREVAKIKEIMCSISSYNRTQPSSLFFSILDIISQLINYEHFRFPITSTTAHKKLSAMVKKILVTICDWLKKVARKKHRKRRQNYARMARGKFIWACRNT